MSLQEILKNLFVRITFSVVAPAATTVLCLYILNSMGDIKYLPASGLAFGVGFFMIYLAFKYWIKPDATKDLFQQFKYFLVVFVINFVINIETVHLLVQYVGVPILTAQTVAAVALAYESYYAYLSLLYRSSKRAVIRRPRSLEDEIVYYDDKGQQI